MESKPQKPSLLFTNPFSLWTELAFKLWGFGEPPAASSAPEKQVAVAVIPTSDAKHPKKTKQKVRGKTRSKRAKR
jgi:hypothetical protein